MIPLTALLTATDFSAPARHAAERAARMAHESGAQLTLMHAIPDSALSELRHWLGAGHGAEQQLREDAAEQLRKLGDQLTNALRVKIRTHLVTGPVIVEIERAAQTLQAAVVVLGARGAGFLRRLVLGSTSERLLGHTRRPVLIVKQTPHEPYRRVLVALDFSPWSLQAIALARRVAPNARLVLLHVFEVPFEGKLRLAGIEASTIESYRRQAGTTATQQLHDIARQAGLTPGQWDARVLDGPAWQRIVEQEQECDCDLMVLGRQGRSAADDFFLGSVTRSVLAEANGDVLVSTAAPP